MKISKLLLLLFSLVAHNSSPAEIYKWVDKEGKVHFSDSPPADTKVEEVTVKETVVGEPDEGELRRRRLLEQANADAAIRLEERRQEIGAGQAQEHVQSIEEQACMDARVQLEVLKEEAPVYRDDQGKWRANWQYDTYRGERAYLNDGDRPATLKRARKNVEAHCEKPDDPKAQAEARTRWIFSERCAVAKAELEAAEQPEAKNPKSTIEAIARAVERYCEK